MSTATQMSVSTAEGIRDFLVNSINAEFPTNKKVVAAVKPGDWRPDPKSKTAMELAWHILSVDIWFLNSIADLKFGEENVPDAPKTTEEMIAWYDQEYPKALARVKAMSGDQLQQIVDFYGMKFPAYVYLEFVVKHAVHHRGQLSTYLRALGGKCPSIYGGSADEPWQG